MFCRNCGKGLGLNPDNICPRCGGYAVFCRNCGKGLVLNPDKTCANCGVDTAKATSFCRYCGKPTGPLDLNCPACGSIIKVIPERDRVPNKNTRRLVKLGTVAVALVTLLLMFSLRAKVTAPVLSWLATFSAPAPKLDFSKNVTIDVVIQNGTYYPDKIYAEAGANLIINFTNKDIGIEHDLVLYREVEQMAVAVASQKPVVGPGTAVYKLKVPIVRPDGAYWFACDQHYATEQGFLYPTSPTP